MSEPLVIEIFPRDAKSSTRTMGKRDVKSQVGYVYQPDEQFPRKFSFNLPDDVSWYPAGQYTLNPRSLRVGQYDRLEFGFVLYLDPVAAVAATNPPVAGDTAKPPVSAVESPKPAGKPSVQAVG